MQAKHGRTFAEMNRAIHFTRRLITVYSTVLTPSMLAQIGIAAAALNTAKEEFITELVMEYPPNPGSKKAVRFGCTCPVSVNRQGWGYIRKHRFIVNDACRIHGKGSVFAKEMARLRGITAGRRL